MASQIKKPSEGVMRKIVLSVVLVFAAAITTFAVAIRIDTQKSVSLSAPDSKPLACSEECPGSDGILRSCTPPEADGSSSDSFCITKEIKRCGGQDFCCPGSGGQWTTNTALCCVDTTWTPAANTVCTGTSFTQTSNCSKTRSAVGTKTDGACVTCTDTTWTPAANTVCSGTQLTQTSNCGTTRTVAGTKTDGACVTCTDTTWTPAANTVCTGTIFTQTSNCGNEREVSGTKSDTTWTPAANTVCSGTQLTQTGDCGGTRNTNGTKTCCVDTTWSPPLSNTCADTQVTQTSNCGNEREVSGTKACYPDISIVSKVYQDDSRNKDGVYYTDKLISKASRDQFIVYTMEIKNSGQGSASNVKVTDTLTGQNQNLVTFVDSEGKCSYDHPSKKLTCEIAKLASKASEKLKFRVKVATTALNGKVIRNTSKVNYSNKTREASVDVLVSSIVSCNEYCTSDSECIGGLACDVFSNKCRKPTCLQDTTCGCTNVTATVTKKPTATVTAKPTSSSVDFPDSSAITETVGEPLAMEPTEIETLPETGVFDYPQTAVFGGGILLAIIGLFLAL